jgi:hypothetical protein
MALGTHPNCQAMSEMQAKRIIILARARGPFEHPPQARKQHRSATG